MALIRAIALHVNKVYISQKENAINVPITFTHARGKADARVLIDSGATKSFINYQTAVRWQLSTRKLRYAREIVNVDGTENKSGTITDACVL